MKCENCGAEFEPKVKRQRFCSRHCQKAALSRKLYKPREKPARQACLECGEEFQPNRAVQQFCSEACRARYYKRQHGEQHKKPKEKKKCLHCGAEFETPYSFKKYCSEACQTAASNARNHVSKPKEKVRKCDHCGAEFEPKSNVQKYCSRRCCQAAEKKREKERFGSSMTEENPLNLRKLSKAEEISLGRTSDILQETVIDYGMPAEQMPREKRGVRFMGQWMPLFKEYKSEPRRSDVPHTKDPETLLRWIFKEGEYAEPRESLQAVNRADTNPQCDGGCDAACEG